MTPIEKLQQEIAAHWTKKITLKRNEFLKVKNTKDQNVYFSKSGCLRMFIEDEKEEHCIRFAYKKSLFTALDSFISGKNSALCIQALKKSEVFVVDKKSFMQIINSNDENMKLWQNILENLIEQQLEREIDLLTYSPEERYKRVLKRSPQLFQEVPLKYIASYLRMTPETLSRIKKS
jgi:CRP-like cAMP-binding protein